MKNKITASAYGSLARWFHWLTAALILITYGAIYHREWLAESDFENWLTIQLHFSIGLTVLGLTLMRILWRMHRPVPLQAIGARWQQRAARAVHAALYVLLLLLPVSGYLSIADYFSRGGQFQYFFMFDLTWLQGIQTEHLLGVSLEQMEKPAASVHRWLGQWGLSVLLAGHVGAALYHHFIVKDDALSRMTSVKQKPKGGQQNA